MTKSPRVVCTVAEYFLLESITVGGGVVRCSMQVTISLSQPGANEVADAPPPEPQPATASKSSAVANAGFTAETLKDRARQGWTVSGRVPARRPRSRRPARGRVRR